MRYSDAVRWPGILMIIAAAAIIAVQVFVPPAVGLANNGDFSKVIGSFSLGAPTEDEFHYADTTYRIEDRYQYDAPFRSSEKLLVGMAIRAFTRGGTFDLRWMGLIHALVLLASVVLLQPCLNKWPLWPRLAISAAMLLVFGDVMYVALLNSFYMDAAALVFLLLAVVAFVRSVMWGRRFDAVLFVIASAMLVTSKAQHAPLGVALAGLCFAFGVSRGFSIVSAIVLLAASAIGWTSVPPDYAPHGIYSVVFHQVLPNSRDLSGDLTALGLNDSYRKWIGTHAYDDRSGMNDPEFVHQFSQRTSYARLGWFFMTHPRDTAKAAIASLAEAGRQRPPLGNFDRGAGLPESAESHRFGWWSSLKRNLFYQHGARYLAVIGGLQVMLFAVVWWRRRQIAPRLMFAAFVLIALTVLSLGIATFADAVEVTRHHLIPLALLDLELICAAVTFLSPVTSQKQPDALPLQPAE